MVVLKAFKYRIYPSKEQEVLIAKHIGSCRFLYNLALETKQMAYAGAKINLSRYELSAQIPEFKKECPWLKEVNAQSLQKALTNMDVAFNNFFKGQAEFPKFKSKSGSRQSFCVPQEVRLEDGKVHLPKFKGGIAVVEHRPLKGEVRQATVSKASTGKYFVSILVETGKPVPEKREVTEATTVGVDLGLKTLIVASDGTHIDNPRHLRHAMERLKYVQSRFSKYKGKRTKKKLALLHEKVANQRCDILHKTSSQFVKNHDAIAIEDLNIKGMSARCEPKRDEKGKYLPNGQSAKSGLNRAVLDAGWGMFVEMLEYKAEWQGKSVIRIGRFDPSSKTCSDCGWIYKELSLNEREWACRSCGAIHDRDINAAKNIKAFALEKNVWGTQTKTHDELPTLVGTMTHEANRSLVDG